MIHSPFHSPPLLTHIQKSSSKAKHRKSLHPCHYHSPRVPRMLGLQSRAIDQCIKAVKADKAGEDRLALYYYKESLSHLMEWLTLEKEVGAREALKRRIRGYMVRAEELKDLLAAAAAATPAGEQSGTATTVTNTTSKGTSAGSRSKNSNNTMKDGGEKSSSSCRSNRIFPAAATTIVSTEVGPQQDGNNTYIQGEEGEKKHDTDISHHRVEDTPLMPLHDSDAIPSSLNASYEKELREREAWLREWEAALVAKDLELQRRVKEVRRMERRVEARGKEVQGENEKKKDSTEKVEGVEGGETAVEGKPAKDR